MLLRGASGAIPNVGGFTSRFARHGINGIISQPTNLRVGEGFHPELVSVTPLNGRGVGGGGRGGGSNNDDRVDRLISAVERLARRSQAMEANLVVDGQRMASVAEKYMGNKSYGGR